tara:strand:- start:147 stop:809 length:663 start_codon:yes stop_codon:yes gene_type:complete
MTNIIDEILSSSVDGSDPQLTDPDFTDPSMTKNPYQYWGWLSGGCALAVCFLLAVILVKPIGVSTQFVIVDGLLANLFSEQLIVEDTLSKTGYSSSNAYLNKSGGKYAAAVAKPWNYGFVFVLSMLLGGWLGRTWQYRNTSMPLQQLPEVHVKQFGHTQGLRYLLTFSGGVIVLFGARLAGGCTSGHMMSGMMQTAVSGYLFTIAVFAAAIPTAIILYRR